MKSSKLTIFLWIISFALVVENAYTMDINDIWLTILALCVAGLSVKFDKLSKGAKKK